MTTLSSRITNVWYLLGRRVAASLPANCGLNPTSNDFAIVAANLNIPVSTVRKAWNAFMWPGLSQN